MLHILKRFLPVLLVFLAFSARADATTYYLANASTSPVGSDSNNGTSPATPWLTPNHAVNCGDIIIAATSSAYSNANFGYTKWGTVTCSAGNNVAWLSCATFDGCKIACSSAATSCITPDQNYWGVQGWEVDGTTATYGCFNVQPNGTGVSIHHIIFANDIATGCGLGCFGASNQGGSITASFDYIAIIGNWAQGCNGGSIICATGISLYQPLASDTAPGTHLFIAGNLANDNVDGNPCNGGAPTDGEGIQLDSIDYGQQAGGTIYAQQIVVENNILIYNGHMGLLVGGSGTTLAHIYLKNNTSTGNNTDASETSGTFQGEIASFGADGANLIQASYNIARANVSTVGSGPNTLYAYFVGFANATTVYYNDWGYAVSGAGNTFGTSNNTGFSAGPNNTTNKDPIFKSPSDPGVPSCGSFTSVPNCFATVAANFKPTASGSAAYGYQTPSTTSINDPLYPTWLCTVTNLPSGLVTPGCVVGSTSPGAVTLQGVTVK